MLCVSFSRVSFYLQPPVGKRELDFAKTYPVKFSLVPASGREGVGRKERPWRTRRDLDLQGCPTPYYTVRMA